MQFYLFAYAAVVAAYTVLIPIEVARRSAVSRRIRVAKTFVRLLLAVNAAACLCLAFAALTSPLN